MCLDIDICFAVEETKEEVKDAATGLLFRKFRDYGD